MTLALALALVSGLMASTLAEYVHHRHAGHRVRGVLRRLHLEHHHDPRQRGRTLLGKLLRRAPLLVAAGVPVGLAAVSLTGVVFGLTFTAGLLFGTLVSECLHHAIHRRAPRNRWEAWLWRHHYYHHYGDAAANFGFTTPLWDWLFGTLHPVREVFVPWSQLPPGSEAWPGLVRFHPRKVRSG